MSCIIRTAVFGFLHLDRTNIGIYIHLILIFSTWLPIVYTIGIVNQFINLIRGCLVYSVNRVIIHRPLIEIDFSLNNCYINQAITPKNGVLVLIFATLGYYFFHLFPLFLVLSYLGCSKDIFWCSLDFVKYTLTSLRLPSNRMVIFRSVNPVSYVGILSLYALSDRYKEIIQYESEQSETFDIENFDEFKYPRAEFTKQYQEEFYKHEPVTLYNPPHDPYDLKKGCWKTSLAQYTPGKWAERSFLKGLYTRNAMHSATIPYKFPPYLGVNAKATPNSHVYNEVIMANADSLKALENMPWCNTKEDSVSALTSAFLNHYFKDSEDYGVYPESRDSSESKGKADFRIKVLKDKNLRTPGAIDYTSTIVEVKTTTGQSPYAGVEQLRGYYDDTVKKNPEFNTNSQNQNNNMRRYAILVCGTKIAFFCFDEILWNRSEYFLSKLANGDHAGVLSMRLGERGIETVPHRECFNSPSKWYDIQKINHGIPLTALASYIEMTSLPPRRSSLNPNVLLEMSRNPKSKQWISVAKTEEGVVYGVNFKGELCQKPSTQV